MSVAEFAIFFSRKTNHGNGKFYGRAPRRGRVEIDVRGLFHGTDRQNATADHGGTFGSGGAKADAPGPA